MLPKAAADAKMQLPTGVEPDLGVLALVDAIRRRCRDTIGTLPHIIVCNLSPVVVQVQRRRAYIALAAPVCSREPAPRAGGAFTR